MPFVIAFVAELIEIYGVWAVAYAAVTLAAVAYSAYMMATAEMPGMQSDANSRLQTVRSSVQPHRIIYGKCMTGGVLVYAQSHGDNNKYISLVVAFCAHEVEEIKEVWLNDKLSTDVAFIKHVAEVPAERYYGYGAEGEIAWVEIKPAIAARASQPDSSQSTSHSSQ